MGSFVADKELRFVELLLDILFSLKLKTNSRRTRHNFHSHPSPSSPYQMFLREEETSSLVAATNGYLRRKKSQTPTLNGMGPAGKHKKKGIVDHEGT